MTNHISREEPRKNRRGRPILLAAILLAGALSALKASFSRDATLGGAAGAILLVSLLAIVFVMLRRTDTGIRPRQRVLRSFFPGLVASVLLAGALSVWAGNDLPEDPLDRKRLVGGDAEVLLSSVRQEQAAAIRIGVLANRGHEVCMQEWGPTGAYLNERLAPLLFDIIPLDFEQLIPAVRSGEVDFVAANPSYYAYLEHFGLASRKVTLQVPAPSGPQSHFGGVILARADRNDIEDLHDLRGKRFAAVSAGSLGGWHAALRELLGVGIKPERDFSELVFLGTHDTVVNAILEAEVDAGTVRSTQIERMAKEGLLDMASIKVIGSRPADFPQYPYALSTRLYPEWPLAALGKTDSELVKRVTLALLQMPEDHESAVAIRGAGWASPEDYGPVRELLQELHLPPYENYGKLTAKQAFRKLWAWLAGLLLLPMLLWGFNLKLARLNRRQQASEEHLSATLRSIGDGVIACDHMGNVTSLNRAGAILTGWTMAEAVGKQISMVFQIVHEQTRETVVNPVYKALREGIAVDLANHTALIARDGSEHQIADSCAPIRDTAGKIVGAVLVFRDVTEEYRQREELRLVREAVECSSNAIGIATAEGRHFYQNAAFTSLFGYTIKELQGPCPEVIYRDPAEAEKVFATIKAGGSVDREIEMVAKDGRVLQVHLLANAVRDEGGKVTGLVGVHVDITATTKAQEELQATLERYRLLADNAEDFVALNGIGGERFYVSPSFYRKTGWSEEDFRSGDWRPRVHPDDLPMVERLHAANLAGETTRGEYRILCKDGSWLWVDSQCKPLLDSAGRVSRMVVWSRDITERKWTESLTRTRLELLNFAAAHPLDELLQKTLDLTGELCGSPIGFFHFVEADQQTLSLQAWSTRTRNEFCHATGGNLHYPIEQAGVWVDCVRQRQPVVHNDYASLPHRKGLPPGHAPVTRELVVPILRSELVVAILGVGNKPHDYTSRDVETVSFLADVAWEIAERKRKDQEIARSREQFELAVQGSNDGIWDWDIRNGSLYLSPKWKEQLGYRDEELENVFPTFSALLHPEDEPDVTAYIEAYFKGGMDLYSREFRMRHKDGSWRWILARGKAIRDADGQPIRMAGSHTDITEAKHVEARLRENDDLLKKLAAQVPGLVYQYRLFPDRRSCLPFASANIRDIYELTPEEVRDDASQVFARIHPDDIGRVVKSIKLSVASLEQWSCDYRVNLPVQGVRWHRGVANPEKMADGSVVWHGYIADITDRKQEEQNLLETNRQLEETTVRANEMAEHAEMANQAKSEFLANMSHEIRTPMNGVIGMTGLLLDTELDEDQRHYAEIVRASGESLLNLVNDILDFSKIEAKKLDLETLDFDLESMLDDFADTMAARAHEKGLELICSALPDVPRRLRGDPGRLRQILNNLVGNAIKFTHQGEVAILVSLAEDKPGNDQRDDGVLLHVKVRDTGIGIPRNRQELIFDKFTQADASKTRQYGGTGLGLAISRQLAELMGGEIGVTSKPGEGSEFWFTVRLGKQEHATPAEPPHQVDLHAVRVLIVDDNATNRELLTVRFSAWDMRPAEAPDGPSALALLRRAVEEKDPFRIAVIDMQMPGMDGAALGEAIQGDPDLAETRMVMLTSVGNRGDARKFAQLGFVGYLTKPVRHDDLRGVLAQGLGQAVVSGIVQRHAATRHTVREAQARFANCKARILLVEDNITNQQVALGIMKKLGLRADAVANGQEALNALETIPYDLVLMDCQMAVMDGFEATARIRDPHSTVLNHAVPVIAMTAHAMQGDRERCLDAGMDGYLAKPVTPEALAEVLSRWLPTTAAEPGSSAEETADGSAEEQETPVWDRPGMLGRLLEDEELAHTVCAAFLGDIPSQIEALHNSLDTTDLPAVERQAHTIKGAASYVGAERLRAVAAAMETAAKTADPRGCRDRIANLEAEFRNVARNMRGNSPANACPEPGDKP